MMLNQGRGCSPSCCSCSRQRLRRTVIPGISDLLQLWDRYRRWNSPVRRLSERFIELCEAHDVTRTQIPRLLGANWGLSVEHVSAHDKLLPVLQEPLLRHVCALFGVNRQWLDGEDVSIYPSLQFYPDLHPFRDFVCQLNVAQENVDVFVIKPSECDVSVKRGDSHDEIAVVFRVLVCQFGQKNVYRYLPLTELYPWNHKPARIRLKAMGLICWTHHFYPLCIELPSVEVNRIASGGAFLHKQLEALLYAKKWHLDDFMFTRTQSHVAADEDEAQEAQALLHRHDIPFTSP